MATQTVQPTVINPTPTPSAPSVDLTRPQMKKNALSQGRTEFEDILERNFFRELERRARYALGDTGK